MENIKATEGLYHYTYDEGIVSEVRGAHKRLRNTANISGNCSKIFGDAKNISGDVSCLVGNVSELSGDVSLMSGFTSKL